MSRTWTQALALSTSMLALVALGSGCSHKTTKVAAVVPAPPPAPRAKPAPAPPPPAPAPAPAPRLTQADLADVYFDFDSSDLRSDDRNTLDKDAKILRENPAVSVRLEGHCDERGTVEYNLALGERRADAARDYLVGAGVATGRVQTISYGKEKPYCSEHTEDCWKQNRRAHVAVTSPKPGA